MGERCERIDAAKERLAQGDVVIAVIGEFKQGKSSLINALLGVSGLLPVDIDIATSVATLARYGPVQKAFAISEAEGRVEVPLDKIAEYASERGNPRNEKGVALIEVEVPSKLLQEGLCLIDTPGVGGLMRGHFDATAKMLPRTDIALYVSDLREPLKEADLRFLQDHVWPQIGSVAYVLTHKDLVPSFEAVVEANRSKLKGAQTEDPKIFAVSTPLYADYIKLGDERDLEDSGYKELEAFLWERAVAEGGKILIERTLSACAAALREAREELEMELAPLKDSANRAPVEQEIQRQREAAQRLAESNAEWRTLLADGMSDLRRDLNVEIQRSMSQLQVEAEGMLQKRDLLKEPDRIGAELKFRLEALSARLEKVVDDRCEALVDRIDLDRDLGMSNEWDANLVDHSEVSFRLTEFKVHDYQGASLAVRVFSGAWGRAGLATSAIPLIFGALVPHVAIVALAIGLAGYGTFDAIEQLDDRRRADVNKVIAKFFQESQLALTNDLMKTVSDAERAIRDDLNAKIQARRKSLDESLVKLQGNLKLTVEETQRKATALATQINGVAAMANRVAEASTMAAKLPDRSRKVRPAAKPKPVAAVVAAPEEGDMVSLGDEFDG